MARYSRATYQDVAKILNGKRNSTQMIDVIGRADVQYVVDMLAQDFSMLFAMDNPAFDRKRFFAAVTDTP